MFVASWFCQKLTCWYEIWAFCFGWCHLEKTKFANTSFSGFLSSGGDGGRRRWLVGCVRRKFAWIRRADSVLVVVLRRGQWTLVVQPGGQTSDPIYLSYSAAAVVHYALKRLFWEAPPALVRWSDRFLDEAFTDSNALISSMRLIEWVATGNLTQISFPRLQTGITIKCKREALCLCICLNRDLGVELIESLGV